MGLLDQIAGGLLKQVLSSERSQNALMETVTSLVKGSGGLGGLAETFSNSGLGNEISSWIGKGENLPISADQIMQVLGSGQVQEIADRMGISTEEASGGLAEILPRIVDQLSPDGEVPNDDLLSQGLSMLGNKLFGK
jgi:uncharacterized protein YidB (DUF937 family)